MGWMGVLPLAPLHTQQYMYAIPPTLPPNSHALQLHFNLTDATHWTAHYNGFSYEEFYEFIVDFFEADATPEAQEASAKLLEWWNKYSLLTSFCSAAADTALIRAVFPRSAATRAAAPTSVGRTSLAILRRQRQAARSSHLLS